MTRLYVWASSVAAVLALLAGIWLLGRSSGRDAAEAAQDRQYRETMERTNDADLSRGDPADDAEWLSRRGGRH